MFKYASPEYYEAATLFTKEELLDILLSMPQKDIQYILDRLHKEINAKSSRKPRSRIKYVRKGG